MAIPTFNDGASFLDVRSIINQNAQKNNKQDVTFFQYSTTPPSVTGNVTSQTSNTITDNTKSWVTNAYADNVVRLVTSDGSIDYAIITSNTATTLTLDANHSGMTFSTYSIIFTVALTQMNSSINVDLTEYGAVILPLVSTVNKGDRTRISLEVTDGTKGFAVICRGTNTQRGLKWGNLIYSYESVSLEADDFGSDHWDIVDLTDIKRYGSFRTNANIPITSTSYAQILATGTITLGQARRFEKVTVSGFEWLKYNSIIQRDFRLSGSLPIQRTGGGSSTVELKMRVYRSATATTEDTVIRTIAKFTGDDTKTIPIDIPFTLSANDRLTLLAQRDAGTIDLLSGASLSFTEM